jgi:hypothetical protein
VGIPRATPGIQPLPSSPTSSSNVNNSSSSNLQDDTAPTSRALSPLPAIGTCQQQRRYLQWRSLGGSRGTNFQQSRFLPTATTLDTPITQRWRLVSAGQLISEPMCSGRGQAKSLLLELHCRSAVAMNICDAHCDAGQHACQWPKTCDAAVSMVAMMLAMTAGVRCGSVPGGGGECNPPLKPQQQLLAWLPPTYTSPPADPQGHVGQLAMCGVQEAGSSPSTIAGPVPVQVHRKEQLLVTAFLLHSRSIRQENAMMAVA